MNERIFLGILDLKLPVRVYMEPEKDRARCKTCQAVQRDPYRATYPNGHRL